MQASSMDHVTGQRAQLGLRYDGNTVLLHWLSATLVVALWLSGQLIDSFGRGTPAMYMRSLHITMGVTLAVVLSVRVIWRLASGRSLPNADPALLHVIARITHYGLYLVAGTTVLLGLLTAWMRGDTIWGLFTVPAYDPANAKSLGHEMLGYHSLLANLILILAGLHAAAALFHHFKLRDGVLLRMLPWRHISAVPAADPKSPSTGKLAERDSALGPS
jgi:cytochrome b561